MNKEVVSLRKVSKWYGGQGGLTKTSIFNEIDFSLKEKEIVGLFAPSGSGKTTFLQIAGLLDTQIEGNVFIFGSKVAIGNFSYQETKNRFCFPVSSSFARIFCYRKCNIPPSI